MWSELRKQNCMDQLRSVAPVVTIGEVYRYILPIAPFNRSTAIEIGYIYILTMGKTK